MDGTPELRIHLSYNWLRKRLRHSPGYDDELISPSGLDASLFGRLSAGQLSGEALTLAAA